MKNKEHDPILGIVSKQGNFRLRAYERRLIINHSDGRCFYCGVVLTIKDKWQPDHMIPISQGGTHHLSNLKLSCPLCNQRKNGRTPNEFKDSLKERAYKKLEDINDKFFQDCDLIENKLRELRKIIIKTKIIFHCDTINNSSKNENTILV